MLAASTFVETLEDGFQSTKLLFGDRKMFLESGAQFLTCRGLCQLWERLHELPLGVQCVPQAVYEQVLQIFHAS